MDNRNLDEMLSHLQAPAPSSEAKEHALNSAMAAFDKKPFVPRIQTTSFYLPPELLGGASVVIIGLAVLNMLLPGSIAASAVATVVYLVGIYLAVTGLFKLGSAAAYFAAGAGLLSVPYLTQGMAGSINNGAGNVGYMQGQFVPPGTPHSVSYVSNIFLSYPISAAFCTVLFLGFTAWAVYFYIKKRGNSNGGK